MDFQMTLQGKASGLRQVLALPRQPVCVTVTRLSVSGRGMNDD